MSWNYPPGVSELPADRVTESEYLFEAYGEVRVLAYSEEDAKEELQQNIKEHLYDAYLNGDLYVQ